MISPIIKNKSALVYPLMGTNIIEDTYYETIHVPTVLKINWDSKQTASSNNLFLGHRNGKELIIKSSGKLEIHG